MRETKLGRWVVYLACALGFGVVTLAATPAHAMVLSDLQPGVIGGSLSVEAGPAEISLLSDWGWT